MLRPYPTFTDNCQSDSFRGCVSCGDGRAWGTGSLAARSRPQKEKTMNEQFTDPSVAAGPPKRKDRKILTAMIGTAAIVVLALIAFVALSDFPGAPEGSEDKSLAPPEDVRR